MSTVALQELYANETIASEDAERSIEHIAQASAIEIVAANVDRTRIVHDSFYTAELSIVKMHPVLHISILQRGFT